MLATITITKLVKLESKKYDYSGHDNSRIKTGKFHQCLRIE